MKIKINIYAFFDYLRFTLIKICYEYQFYRSYKYNNNKKKITRDYIIIIIIKNQIKWRHNKNEYI